MKIGGVEYDSSELRRICDKINKDYFCNAINITNLKWRSEQEHRRLSRLWAHAFYSGDHFKGEIVIIEREGYTCTVDDIWCSIFHEMLHQIIYEHSQTFCSITHAVEYFWDMRPLNREVMKNFCRILFDHIAMKVEADKLPDDFLDNLIAFPLYRFLMGENVALCKPPIIRPYGYPNNKPCSPSPFPDAKDIDLDWYHLDTWKGKLNFFGGFGLILFLGWLLY